MTKERGHFKSLVKKALFLNNDVTNILFGEEFSNKSKAEQKRLFDDKVKSHLFLDEIIEGKDSYIFFDVIAPEVHKNTKRLMIILYAISHREILDDFTYGDDFYGNKSDMLGQAVEEALLDSSNSKEFGIGDLNLLQVDLFNSKDFYGVKMVFDAVTFN